MKLMGHRADMSHEVDGSLSRWATGQMGEWKTPTTLPGGTEKRIQLGGQVPANVGLGGRDSQSRGQGVRGEGRLQHH